MSLVVDATDGKFFQFGAVAGRNREHAIWVHEAMKFRIGVLGWSCRAQYYDATNAFNSPVREDLEGIRELQNDSSVYAPILHQHSSDYCVWVRGRDCCQCLRLARGVPQGSCAGCLLFSRGMAVAGDKILEKLDSCDEHGGIPLYVKCPVSDEILNMAMTQLVDDVASLAAARAALDLAQAQQYIDVAVKLNSMLEALSSMTRSVRES